MKFFIYYSCVYISNIILVLLLLSLNNTIVVSLYHSNIEKLIKNNYSNFKLYNNNNNEDNNVILKRIDNWACVKDCGACCKLGPLSTRPELKSYLTKEEYDLYVSMINPVDNYCNHYDKINRMCTVYDTRPSFCQVNYSNINRMFDINKEDFNDFCSFCCREQISDVYGEESKEMTQFERVIQSLEDDEHD